MAERCDVTDLLAEQCAHCRKLPDPPLRELGRPFPAEYDGRCIDCGDWFTAGATIRRDSEECGYVGPCCAAPP